MFGVLAKSQKYFTARQVELGNLNGHIEEVYCIEVIAWAIWDNGEVNNLT